MAGCRLPIRSTRESAATRVAATEYLAAADLAFGAIEGAGLAQCEALMGITPGGGAMQLLRDRLGRNRALEIVLGADLLDAETAARYGCINRAILAQELDAFVDCLAGNIAALPPGLIAAAKAAMPASDLHQGLQREHAAWAGLFERTADEALIRGELARGAQTVERELRLEQMLRDICAAR